MSKPTFRENARDYAFLLMLFILATYGFMQLLEKW